MKADCFKPQATAKGWLDLAVLLLAMSFPTLMAWLYFVALPGDQVEPSPAQQAAYALGKVIQFGFPLLYVRWLLGSWPRPRLTTTRGILGGVLFGMLVVACMLGLYFLSLRDSTLLAGTPGEVQAKLVEMGVASPGRYLALAGFICLLHSLLEEYYWRWFVFGRLRQHVLLSVAALLSSLAFMAHHVVILYVYLPGRIWDGVLPFSLAIAVGGLAWAWLYQRSGSLLGPWLSHLIVDVGIFYLGWELAARAG